MSEKSEGLKYFEKLNIPSLTINSIKKIIKQNIENTVRSWEKGKRDLPKQTFRIIGPAGVGKTEVCKQIANELSESLNKKFHLKMIKAPVVTRDDFIIPFPVKEKDGIENFKMLISDFVPTEEDSYGLFVIDECSRGDYALQQLMWQIQNEQMIHTHQFPKGWFVIAVDNPDDSEYNMESLEDAAGLRRMLHFYTDVSVIDFINHGIKTNFHPAVIEFIQTFPEYIYDFKAQKAGGVYANPASYERVSNILWGLEDNDLDFKENLDYIEYQLGGLINIDKARLFINFLNDFNNIKPSDIFYNYNIKVKNKIKLLLDSNNNAALGELLTALITYLQTTKPSIYKENCEEIDEFLNHDVIKNLADFLCDIPIDTACMYVIHINNLNRTSDEYLYFTKTHVKMIKYYERYKIEFYNKMINLRKEEK